MKQKNRLVLERDIARCSISFFVAKKRNQILLHDVLIRNFSRWDLGELGINRILSIGNPKNVIYTDSSYPYSERELEVFHILSMDFAYNAYNINIMNELNHMESSLEPVRYEIP